MDNQLLLGFLLSLLLHAALVALLLSRGALPEKMRVFDVDLIVEPPQPLRRDAPPPAFPATRQIVTPPEAGRNQAPKDKDTRFLSDVDSAAPVEQIRRGDDPQAGPLPGSGAGSPRTSARRDAAAREAAAAPRPAGGRQRAASPSKAQETAIAKPLDLTPDYTELSRLGAAARAARPQAANGGTLNLAEPEPFSRAPGAGARIIGFNGMSDHLPGVRDGDITMLNAKADKFAVFVRRVATQVFNQLKQQGWGSLQARDIQLIRDYATVRACLSPQGKLLTVELLGGSASPRFDDILQRSVRDGARDPHPPAAARADDGNFYFIFMAKSWVRAYSDPRSGGFGEQRWLLLKTGLE